MYSGHIAFCIPTMIIGGVETVFINTVEQLLKNKNIKISIITHAYIREPVHIKWLELHPEISVYTMFPLCNWFEDLTPKCRGILKPIRKIIFGIYKSYRRILFRIMHPYHDLDVFIDYKNAEFFKELKYWHKPRITWVHCAPEYCIKNKIFNRLDIYNRIVVLTDEFISETKKLYPQYATKTTRIYNPIDTDKIQNAAKNSPVPHGKYFTHVSRLVAGKDIPTLLNAFEIFAENYSDVKLYIVGDGDMADDFKSCANKLKCRDQIIFTGTITNPYPIMAGAVANILSSLNEGLPTVCIESQVLNIPIIASNCHCGTSEILENGKSGLLFDVGNARQLGDCMSQIYSDKKLAAKLNKNASAGLTRFRPDTIIAQILELLESVTDKSK